MDTTKSTLWSGRWALKKSNDDQYFISYIIIDETTKLDQSLQDLLISNIHKQELMIDLKKGGSELNKVVK